MEGAIPIPNFGEATSPIKLVEKESTAAIDDIAQPAQEKESVPTRTVPEGPGDVVVGGSRSSQPAVSLAPRASTQGSLSSSTFEGRGDVSFPELYASVMTQFNQQQALLAKMKW